MIHMEFDWPILPGLSQEQMICLARSGTPEQFWNMARSFLAGTNSFQNREYFEGEVLFENEDWFAFAPMSNFNRHQSSLRAKFIIALKHSDPQNPNEHLPYEAFSTLSEVLKAVGYDELKKLGGMLYLRFGPMEMNGGTMPAAPHFNLDIPSGNHEIRPVLYKSRDGWRKDYDRLLTYLKVYRVGINKQAFVDAHNAL